MLASSNTRSIRQALLCCRQPCRYAFLQHPAAAVVLGPRKDLQRVIGGEKQDACFAAAAPAGGGRKLGGDVPLNSPGRRRLEV
jgi:hypothetical protein